jgi:hypothetical protein
MLERVKSSTPINWPLISNPVNWIIVLLMCALAIMAVRLICSVSTAPAKEASE